MKAADYEREQARFNETLWPNSDVLRNYLDIRDAAALTQAEAAIVSARAADLPTLEVSWAGYKAIHRHLFSDLYNWAGQPRTYPMIKQGADVGLQPPTRIIRYADWPTI